MSTEARRLTILIADDHPVYRQGLERAIGERDELELVASSADGREALERINELEPDVAVVDVRMPGLDGLKILAAVRRDGLRTRVMLLTGYEDATAAFRALDQGAAGYVSKASDHTELIEAILTAGRGETVVAPRFEAGIAAEVRLQGSAGRPALSARESEVLALLAEGRTKQWIGAYLDLAEATLQTHMYNLFEKLGASDRGGAVAAAMRWGLLE